MWQCKVADTLGDLEGTHKEVWGTSEYMDNKGKTVFFGVYGLPDFYTVWKHKGQRAVLWAGSDIRHLQDNYWLEDGGGIRIDNKGMCEWINKWCDNYCENEVEYEALKKLGIESSVIPSFMGNVKDFTPCFTANTNPHVYSSVSGNDFKLYGWDKIKDIALANPEITFHMYGNTEPFEGPTNMIVHGRVPKEQMNEEIKGMQACIRAVEFDGFSEIVAKALLYEQYVVSAIDYPTSIPLHSIHHLRWKDKPNKEGREWLLENVNKFPWNEINKKTHRILEG